MAANKSTKFNVDADDGNKIKRTSPGPRPAYITYVVKDASGNEIEDATIDVQHVCRKADEMLEYVDANPGSKWTRFKIK